MSDSSDNLILKQVLKRYQAGKSDNLSSSTTHMYEILNEYVEEIVLNTYLYEELQGIISGLREKVS
jgi:hypothetical protein